MKIVKIALATFKPVLGNVESNLQEISQICSVCRENQVSLVCFPELIASGYLLENLTGEVFLQESSKQLDMLLDHARSLDIILGCIWKEDLFYSAALVLGQGKIIAVQKKIYLPTYGMFDEARYFSSGNTLSFFETCLGLSSVLICEDAWHPALVYSAYAAGCRHIFIISASPARGFSERSETLFATQVAWRDRLQIYAESFGIFLYYVNLSGIEDGVSFGGESYVISPAGEICLGQQKQAIHMVELDVSHEFEKSLRRGGPFQAENFLLNQKIMEEALLFRKNKT